MAHCAVPMCTNDARYQDKSKQAEKRISFHQFPKDKELRKKWIVKVKRDEGPYFTVTDNTHVCSAHFKDEDFKRTLTGMRKLKPGVIPSQFQWTAVTSRKPPKVRKIAEPTPTPSASKESNPKVPQNTVGSDHDYTCTPTTDAHKLVAAKEYIKQLEEKVEKYEIERFGLARYSTNPDDIRFFTGFTSYELLKSFFHSLAPYAARIIVWTRHKRLTSNMCSRMYDTGNSCKLQLINQLLMFLKKIRLATLDQELAFQFCVSQSTVSRNTITWANFLYCVLGSQPLWPSREQVQRAMPSSFLNKYPAVRVILDCTELKVQSPSSLVLNSELYSHYKGTTTFKSLVGIAPSGLLTFVSSLYAGSISDKHITGIRHLGPARQWRSSDGR